MLQLHPMRADELSSYLAFNNEASAIEMAANYAIELEKAQQVIVAQTAARLPAGVDSEDDCLFCLELERDFGHELIGYLWFSINRAECFAWLEAIDILAPFQNHGYGSAALALAEEQLSAQGIRRMSLHVAGTNQRALRFYQRQGYGMTGYNLKKNW